MKAIVRIISIISLLAIWSACDVVETPGCLTTEGDLVELQIEVPDFKRILVFKRVKLFVSQGPTTKVVVRTGENLIEEVSIRVEDSILKLSDRNSCNLLRDYDVTRVYVTAPNIEEIRNSSGLTIENIGPIRWANLALLAEDRESLDEFQIDGDFTLTDLDVGNLRLEANGVSTFRLQGRADNANFVLADGDVRIEAGDFLVDRVNFIHRGTNKMIIHPLIALRGSIRSVGDVISKNEPPVVEVEELFRGRLIFD